MFVELQATEAITVPRGGDCRGFFIQRATKTESQECSRRNRTFGEPLTTIRDSSCSTPSGADAKRRRQNDKYDSHYDRYT